jgi:ribosomal protein S18
MNNIEYKDLKTLLRFYTKPQLIKAFFVDLYVFIMLGGVFLVIIANLIPMMMRFLNVIIIILYVFLVLVSYFSKRYFVITLKNYKDVKYINYKHISLLLTMISAIVIMIITVVVFTIIA